MKKSLPDMNIELPGHGFLMEALKNAPKAPSMHDYLMNLTWLLIFSITGNFFSLNLALF
ncbi:hypothetical protein SAMN05660284_02813 [Formivibrio citricus]|uniref:Uncharacterized protein n=1 Tax=Formivibrio citricus TaxID=83765 RepID=A0A1I5E2I0_9NEIS|nr:hypothetical protein SAMN05660284_02813 [Formivibrio citricus]